MSATDFVLRREDNRRRNRPEKLLKPGFYEFEVDNYEFTQAKSGADMAIIYLNIKGRSIRDNLVAKESCLWKFGDFFRCIGLINEDEDAHITNKMYKNAIGKKGVVKIGVRTREVNGTEYENNAIEFYLDPSEPKAKEITRKSQEERRKGRKMHSNDRPKRRYEEEPIDDYDDDYDDYDEELPKKRPAKKSKKDISRSPKKASHNKDYDDDNDYDLKNDKDFGRIEIDDDFDDWDDDDWDDEVS